MTLVGLVLLLLIVSPIFIGLVLLILGRGKGRGKLSDPMCSKCSYNLNALTLKQTPNCPECGNDLTVKRAIVFESERTERGWVLPMLVGTGILVLLFVFFGRFFVDWL